MYCPKCGASVVPGTAICPICGGLQAAAACSIFPPRGSEASRRYQLQWTWLAVVWRFVRRGQEKRPMRQALSRARRVQRCRDRGP